MNDGERGLYRERTRLAWVRTGAVLAACGLGAAGAAVRHGTAGWVPIMFTAAALVGAVLLVRTGIRSERVERALGEGRPLVHTWDLRLAWLGVLAVVVGALVLVISINL